MRTCAKCGNDFPWMRPAGQRGRPPLYCSTKCKSAARPHVAREKLSPERRSELAAASAAARWSNVTADERSAAARHRALGRFTPEQIAAHAARLAELDAKRSAPCPYCGDPVGRAGRVTCSRSDCRLSRVADRMVKHNQARRALNRDAFVEKVDPAKVYARDGWICGICDKPVDPSLRAPSMLRVSLDHIVPISLGGEHSYANTRCSHLLCNVARGNRVA